MDLHLKYRPKSFKELVGQEEMVRSIRSKTRRGDVPHAILLTGGSGMGKTTTARLIGSEIGCPYETVDGKRNPNFMEYNCAKDGSIDMVRMITDQMWTAAWFGGNKVYYLDEVQSLSRAGFAQQSMLKMLEEPPNHVYFILAATEPDKLIPTIRTRCTEFRVKPLSDQGIKELLTRVAVLEAAEGGKGKKELTEDVFDKIAELAEGSARKALVLLQQVIDLESEEEMLETLQRSDTKTQAFDLVKTLLWQNVKWSDVAKILKNLPDQDWEGMRRLVLRNAGNELLKANNNAGRAYLIIMAFSGNFQDSGRDGLIGACFEAFRGE